MNSRETELLQAIEINNQKIVQNAGNDSKVRAIMVENEAIQAELEQIKNSQAEQEQAAKERIQQDHESRVTKSTDELFDEIDNVEVSNGMRLRDIVIDEKLYQSASIVMKGLFQAKVDKLSQSIAKLESENSDLTARLKKSTEDQQKAVTELNQERLDHAQTQQYRTNVAELLEEAQKEIEQLKEQLKAATAGVKTTNTEEEQRKKAENDAKIKLERTIYNVIPDNPLNIKSYTANYAATGKPFTIPYYALKSYIVIPESEVSQFRQEFGIAETTSTDTDNEHAVPTTEDIQDSVTEVTLPTIPSAVAPETDVPAEVQLVVPAPTDGGQGKTVEERLSALEAHVFGYVKQAS